MAFSSFSARELRCTYIVACDEWPGVLFRVFPTSGWEGRRPSLAARFPFALTRDQRLTELSVARRFGIPGEPRDR
jgi:hypothetical protein